MRIALISDLHIGKKVRGLDMCPHVIPPAKKSAFVEDYLGYFLNFLSSAEFTNIGPIDILCVTGDISDQADPAEFRRADEVLRRIAEGMKVPIERLYFAPGNHDVHWTVANLPPRDFWGQYRYEPLLQPNLLFRSQVMTSSTGALDSSPHFVVWNKEDHLVVSLNSAAYDAPQPSDREHHGLVHSHTLQELNHFLTNRNISEGIPRICLVHHHPILYSDPAPVAADFSALTNAGNLFDLLSNHKFDLVLHGHKHAPHLERRPGPPNGHPITVLGAGSFSAQLDSSLGSVTNQFHVVHIDGRNASTGALCGYISTWGFDISGNWKVSHSRTGLCASEAFGSLVTSTELEAAIVTHTDSLIAKHRQCTWEDLISAAPTLRHANTKNAYSALQNVAASKGLKLLGDVDSNRNDWTLLPPRKS